jgi:hypothetical protein
MDFLFLGKLKFQKLPPSRRLFIVRFLLGLFLGPEYGGCTFHRTVGKLISDYMTSHPQRQHS